MQGMQETWVWFLAWEDPLEEGPLQYSFLENLTDRGASQATIHGVAKSWTRLNMDACTFYGKPVLPLLGSDES